MSSSKNRSRGLKILLWIIIIILILAIREIFYLNMMISNMDRNMDNIYISTSNLENRNREYFNDIDEKLRSENNLIERTYQSISKVNKEKLTAEIYFKVEPRKVLKNTKVFLDFSDELVEMDREEDRFILIKDIEIFNNYKGNIGIIVENKGVKQVTSDYRIDISSLPQDILANVNARMFFEPKYKNQTYDLKERVTVNNRPSQKGFGFSSVDMIMEVNGEIIRRREVKLDDDWIKLDEKIKVPEGKKFDIKLIAIDDLNLRHEYYLDSYIDGKSTGEKKERLFIYNSDNKLVYDSRKDRNYY